MIQRISAALAKILSKPEIIEKFQQLGAEARSATPQEFQAYLQKEDARWVPIIRQAGITAQ